jgi:hypothetical protein
MPSVALSLYANSITTCSLLHRSRLFKDSLYENYGLYNIHPYEEIIH